MNRPLSILAGLLVLILILACGSSDDGSGVADAQLADVSQFPTPTRSRAGPQPTAQPETELARVSREDSESGEVEPMSEAEVQQLRQRLQSGDLSEEEARQAFQRLREQFGGGGPGGSQAIGSIESVEDSAFTLATELASVSVSVGEDTVIRVTSTLEPAALTDGAQVMVVSERVEGSTLARAITVIPEGQAGFRGGQGGPGGRQGGFGGGQLGPGGVGGLFGTVTDVSDSGFTLETQQGPLPIVVDDESVIIETRQGTFTDLEAGMQVRVTGPADENGIIDARSVTVTPEGLEIIGRPGGGS